MVPSVLFFRLKYYNWKITEDLAPVTLTEEISIWGGQYFFENKVTISGAPVNANLVTGTINFYSNSYDTMVTPITKALYTFDKQSENKDQPGLGIMVNKKTFRVLE